MVFQAAEAPTLLAESVTTLQSLSKVGDALYVNSWTSPDTTVMAVSISDGSVTKIGTAKIARSHVADASGIYLASLGKSDGPAETLNHMSFDGSVHPLGTFSGASQQTTLVLAEDLVLWQVLGGEVAYTPKP